MCQGTRGMGQLRGEKGVPAYKFPEGKVAKAALKCSPVVITGAKDSLRSGEPANRSREEQAQNAIFLRKKINADP